MCLEILFRGLLQACCSVKKVREAWGGVILFVAITIWFWIISPFLPIYLLFKAGSLKDILVTGSNFASSSLPHILGFLWLLFVVGCYAISGIFVGYDRAPLAGLLLLFAVAVVVVIFPLVVRIFKEGERGLLCQRWRITRVRKNLSNGIIVGSAVFSTVQQAALCFMDGGLWNNGFGVKQVKAVLGWSLGEFGVISPRVASTIAIAGFLCISMAVGWLAQTTLMKGGHIRRSFFHRAGPLLGIFAGPLYNFSMQVFLSNMMVFTAKDIFLPVGTSFALSGYSLLVLLFNLISAGKPPLNRDVVGTGVTGVLPPVLDLVLTALSVLSKAGRINAVAPPIAICGVSLMWLCVIIIHRPSSLRDVNLFFAATRALAAWAATATLFNIVVSPTSPLPVASFFAGWVLIIILFLVVRRCVGLIPFAAPLEGSLVPEVEEEAIAEIAEMTEPRVVVAMRYLNKPIAEDDPNPEATRASNLRRALKAYDRGHQEDPRNLDYLDGLTHVLYELKRYDDALLAVDRAVSIRNNFERDDFRGRILIELGRYEEALASASRARGVTLYLTPPPPAPTVTCALALAHLGRFEEAQGLIQSLKTYQNVNDDGHDSFSFHKEEALIHHLQHQRACVDRAHVPKMEAEQRAAQQPRTRSPTQPDLGREVLWL
jgi:hypothetical protein